MLVLLVDDEQSLLDIFSQTLIAGGMQVVTANNGKDALDKAKTNKPDIILLDQVLPDMNGNQVLSVIKKDPEIKNIPVAMLSNFTQNGLVDEAISAGALDYILKYQIEPKDLIAKVNDLIREHASKPGISDDRMNIGNATPTPIQSGPTPPQAAETPAPTPAAAPMATEAPAPSPIESTPAEQANQQAANQMNQLSTPVVPAAPSSPDTIGVQSTPTPSSPDTIGVQSGQAPLQSGQAEGVKV